MLIEYLITIQRRDSWWKRATAWLSQPKDTEAKSVTDAVKKLLPGVGKQTRQLPIEEYSDRTITGFADTYNRAYVWWVEGYPEGDGNFIVLVEPFQAPTHVDQISLSMFGNIERRLTGYQIISHKLRYHDVEQVFAVQEPQAKFWVPETIAFVSLSAVYGLWLAFEKYRPPQKADEQLYSSVENILIGALGSSVLSFLIVLIAWRIRKRQAKSGRKVVYQDGR